MKIRREDHDDRLDAEDFSVEELREVVFSDSVRLPRVLALSLLAKKTYPEKLDDFRRVLSDEAQVPKVRHVAAIELFRDGSDEARQVLMDNIEVKDELVLRGVLDSLSSLGGPETLEAVATRREQETAIRSAVEPVMSMTSYRLNVEGFEVAYPEQEQFIEIDPERSETVELEPGDPETVTKSIADLSKSMPATALSSEGALTIQCGNRSLMFLFDQGFADLETPRQLLERKAAPGVVAVRYTLESDTWETRYYVFTQPVEGSQQIQILLTTTKGTVAFAGTADVEGERAVFALRTVEHPGAVPVEIDGIYEAGELHIEQARSELRSRAQLVPGPRKR